MLTGRGLARVLGSLGVGVVIGVVGTGVHRLVPPWGLVGALVIVLVGGVLGRAWSGWAGVLAVGLGVAAATGVLGAGGPGGDVIVAAQPIGYAWFAGSLVAGLAGVLPHRWFRDDVAPRSESLGDRP